MKNLIFAALLLFSGVSIAQEATFQEEWEQVDSLEVNGLIESADDLVVRIMRNARKAGDYPDFIKARIYHYKLYQVNHESSGQYILSDLNRTIAATPVPYKNILLSYKGQFLQQYYRDNRWTIRNRSDITNPDAGDLETWSESVLLDSIKTALDRSLQNEKVLIGTPTSAISELILPDHLNRKYKPTLYDLLAHRALEFYSDSGNFPSVGVQEGFGFDSDGLYAIDSKFLMLRFPEQVSNTSEAKVLETYQKLEALHAEDENPEAKVFAQLQRLEYVNSIFMGDNKWQLYKEALENLADRYRNDPVHALILYTRATNYVNRATEQDGEGNLKHPGYLQKAVALAEEITTAYPNSDSAQKAYRLISSVKAVQLQARIPQFLASNEPGRIFLSYKSLDSVELRIARLESDFAQKLGYDKDSVITRLTSNDPVHVEKFALPKADDYNNHSTELLLPGQEPGSYLIYISGKDASGKPGFSYGVLQVSDLSLSQTSFEEYAVYRALHRKTGEPLNKVKIEFFDREDRIIYRDFTDKQGEIKRQNVNRNNMSHRVRATTPKDTLNTAYWQGRYYYSRNERVPAAALTMLYLDRAIYRPGQKVYFKGVLLEHENGKTRAVPNEYVEVYVDDPNGEEVAEFRLQTNKYGSFNGEFILPTTGITGEFRIYTAEDAESDTPFWNKLWDSGNYLEHELAFSVEEYKRPTFKVEFDSIRESFKLQDTVHVTGNVSSFMGATLNNARVTFEIERQKLVKYWWYHRYEDPVRILADSTHTDAEGNFKIEFPAVAAQEDLKDENLIYQYTLRATVTDVSGETREASTTLKLGNKNLLLNLQLAENFNPGDTITPQIKATNLNDIAVPVTGTLKIYKLKGPDRVLGSRLFEAPEIQLIPEEEFRKLFPEEPYESELPPEEWPKGTLVYESGFTTDGSYEPEIPVTTDWESGRYITEVQVTGESNSATAEKAFDVINPEDKYLPDHRRFNVSLQNSDFRKDGRVLVLIQTGYKDLNLHVAAYDKDRRIFRQFLNIDGRKLVAIPVGDISSEEIRVEVSGVKNNSVLLETIDVPLPHRTRSLRIETETFRNKIQPGLEEAWSFSIRDDQNEIPDAEVLASMYDASLDQFKTQTWSTEPGFGQSRTRFPGLQFSDVGQVTQLINKFPRQPYYREQQRVFDRLHLFGFYFGQPNSYLYRNYLNKKRNEKRSSDLQGNIRGRITDAQGMSVPGANIVIEGTNKGTQTNFDGEFAVDAEVGAVLVVSSLGYITTEYQIGKEKEIYIILEEDSAQLEEVVVMGYGDVQEEAEEIAFMKTAEGTERNAATLLAGKVAGISVQDGEPGAGSTIRIRGASSIGSGETPLYVVDGKIVTEYDLNSEDVLGVEVLKGAQATALYGAQAANGVVIITTKKGLEDLQTVEARKNLDETAFFYPDLTLGEDGRLQFSFTSPEALTQWKVRLLGHTADWTTGKYEGTVVTQKDLNVVPNPPRFLREGDSIVFKAKVSNLSGQAMSGTAILQLYDALTMQPIDTLLGNTNNLKTFNLAASNSAAVSWQINVPVGVQAVTYRILAKAGDFSDGEENLLPVLSNRMLVTETLPFFVRAGETETYQFTNLKENDSETLQHHKFTLEYSSNPAWYAIQSLPYLMEFEHECSEQIFARLYANSLSAKILNSQPKIKEVFEAWQAAGNPVSNLEKNEELKSLILAETPWVRDAASETEQKQRLAELFNLSKLAAEQKENLSKLRRMQYESGAFPWFPGGPDNFFITRHIVAGLGHLDRLDVQIDDAAIIEKAVGYLDREFLKDAERARARDNKMESFYKSISNLHYLYARSFHIKQYPLTEDVQKLADEIVRAQKENWIQNSLYNKALLTLVLNRFGEEETSGRIIASLKETAVKSEDYGMYWKENTASWYWYQAPVETQALLIEAFTDYGDELRTVEEMKIWLLQNKRTNHWPTTKATTEASYALLMQGNDWLQMDDNTRLLIGGEPISTEKLAETEKEAGTGYLKLHWNAAEIDTSFSEITVQNNNTTAGYGGAYWQYFEDLDKIRDHAESPLNVEKELYLNVSDNSGTRLQQITSQTQLKTGDLVTVRLVVRSTADMDYIHLKDMRASGFEPTNVLSEYKYRDGTGYYESTRDAATHFFFDSLRKGTYVLEYNVRANNAGNFSNGITRIESMYAPEFSGHTKGIRVEIGD